jgi:hypothetical protein
MLQVDFARNQIIFPTDIFMDEVALPQLCRIRTVQTNVSLCTALSLSLDVLALMLLFT